VRSNRNPTTSIAEENKCGAPGFSSLHQPAALTRRRHNLPWSEHIACNKMTVSSCRQTGNRHSSERCRRVSIKTSIRFMPAACRCVCVSVSTCLCVCIYVCLSSSLSAWSCFTEFGPPAPNQAHHHVAPTALLPYTAGCIAFWTTGCTAHLTAA
jgi:hypothetical protein